MKISYIILFILFLTPLSKLFSQITASDTTQANNSLPFYVGGSVGVSSSSNENSIMEKSIFVASAGVYFTKQRESSILVEFGHIPSKIYILSAGISINLLNFSNNHILTEVMPTIFGGVNGHPSGGITILANIRYLHRFNNKFGLNLTARTELLSPTAFYLCVSLQFN